MTDTTSRRPIPWRSHALSDVGCVRKVNEDSIIARPEQCFWAVADGMGGHHVGDVASRKIVELLGQVEACENLSDATDAIEDALITANQQLMAYARREFNGRTTGSTVVGLLIKQNVGVCLWVGDSRLYRYRNGELQQLTRDHSQVEEMVKMGLISEEEAQTHPHKNVITRAVGVERELFVEISVFNAQVGDTFLLCSDGLYNSVARNKIETILAESDSEACALDLMKASLDNGADDNVSLIVIKGEAARSE